MPILTSFRRLFGNREPIEVDARSIVPAEGEVTESIVPVAPGPSSLETFELLQRLEAAVEGGRDAQDRTRQSLESLPRAVTALERFGAGQAELLEAVRELGENADRRAESESAVLARLSDLLDRESALFSLIQEQLDANHAITERTASRLDHLAEALQDTAGTNRATAEAMEALAADMRERERRSEERTGAMQGWIITCVVACLAATAAALALAWAVLGQGS